MRPATRTGSGTSSLVRRRADSIVVTPEYDQGIAVDKEETLGAVSWLSISGQEVVEGAVDVVEAVAVGKVDVVEVAVIVILGFTGCSRRGRGTLQACLRGSG